MSDNSKFQIPPAPKDIPVLCTHTKTTHGARHLQTTVVKDFIIVAGLQADYLINDIINLTKKKEKQELNLR